MPNRLADASSLYLRQHADNPVDWHPWDEEALARARREDKPILLSIGYSACHWCHVMAHESFEDPDTAAVMNELFVNIKVDREERPDLDRIYQLAHQLLAQRPGGWPLTVFLTPGDRMPFFAGTYFPRLPRHGLPAFVDVMRQIAAFYHERRADLERQNAALAEVYRRIEAAGAAADGMPERATLDRARQLLEAEFDPRHGGFGGAPKFPQPSALGLFMRLGRRGDRPAGRMALFSLEQMRQGGLYDQLGGGFFRYCVDADWTVPHFEKMLYDNGALLPLYAEAARATGLETLREAVRDTAGWLLREMRLPGGAFAASLDADSPGGEGAYYLWTPDELRARLPEAEYAVAARHYGLENPANFEGRWHLLARQSPASTAEALGLDEAEVRRRLQRARARLLAARAARPAPGRDAKVLTAWNALAIGGLARAARLLEDDALLLPAEAAAGFLHAQARRAGRLYAVWAAGAPRQPAFLDDAAFLLEALLELLQARWDPRWLDWARELAELLLNEFADTRGGGFFFTAAEHEALIHRPKSFADESLPAGNAVAAGALLRLGWLLGETRYLEAAEATLRAGAAAGLDRAPQAHCRLLLVLEDFHAPPPVVILRAEAARLRDWRARIPPESGAEVYAIPVTAAELPGALAGRAPRGDGVAYLCRGTHCAPPVTDPAELEQALRASA